MKKATWILLILFFSITTFAQPTNSQVNNYNSDYNRDRREAQKNYEKQADANRQPNSKSAVYTPLSQAELREAAKIFERQKTAEEIAREEKRNAETKRLSEAYRIEEARKREEWSIESKKRKLAQAPNVEKLLKDGFYPNEASRMSEKYYYQTSAGEPENSGFIENVLQSKNNIDYLRINYQTKPYDSLSKKIENLVDMAAPFTAIDYLNVIEGRFADKRLEIQALKIKIVYGYIEDYASFADPADSQGYLKKITDFYMEAEEKNPSVYLELKAKCREDIWNVFSPYAMIYKTCNWHLECKTCSDSKTYNGFKKTLKVFREREAGIKKTLNLK